MLLGNPPPQLQVWRKLNAAPTDVTDPEATRVYQGTGAAAQDPITNLLPTTTATPRAYHYALFFCDAGGANCAATGLTASISITVSQALLGGGYTIYFRHTETVDQARTMDVCADNTGLGYASAVAGGANDNWWKSCTPDVEVTPNWDCTGATARQLSQKGIDDALLIGTNMRARNIPVGTVLSSEFCRGLRTAERMALGPTPQTRPELTYFVYANVRNRCVDHTNILNTEPTAGTNTVVVAHSAIASDSTFNPPLPAPDCSAQEGSARGNAVIYKPRANTAPLEIQRGISPAQWATLE